MEFFDGPLNAATYDAQSAAWNLSETGAEGDIAYYRRIAVQTGEPILDLGTGTGRIAFPLAEAGFSVTGLDRSEVMLAEARAKLAKASSATARRIRFERGAMQNFDLPDRFGLILVPFHGFQELLTPEAQRSCLGAISRHLRPTGLAVIHIFDPNLAFMAPEATLASRRQDLEVSHPITGNNVVVRRVSRDNDPVHQVRTEHWQLTQVDDAGRTVEVERSVLRLRWTYRYEMQHLFELEGFDVVSEHSDFEGSPAAYARAQIWTVRAAPQDSDA